MSQKTLNRSHHVDFSDTMKRSWISAEGTVYNLVPAELVDQTFVRRQTGRLRRKILRFS